MDSLPVIPMPPAKKWRVFLARYLPLMVFACTVGGVFALWPARIASPAESNRAAVRENPAKSGETLTNLYVRRIAAPEDAKIN
jgi:hypothetical protein